MDHLIRPLILSPPFGNYIANADCTRVMGTYTLNPRPGLFKQVVKTLRPIKGGWVNKVGLCNPGATNIKTHHADRIYSVAGLSDDEWLGLVTLFPINCMIELNISCPNTYFYHIGEAPLQRFVARFPTLIAKLSPSMNVDKTAARCVDNGIRILHLSNTIAVRAGGESGERLKQMNLPIVERIAREYPDITIIAGGGIYLPKDVKDYRNAGATIFSIATVYFTPWRVQKIIEEAYI
jgi:dihydroorotate dehydrogenase